MKGLCVFVAYRVPPFLFVFVLAAGKCNKQTAAFSFGGTGRYLREMCVVTTCHFCDNTTLHPLFLFVWFVPDHFSLVVRSKLLRYIYANYSILKGVGVEIYMHASKIQ